MAERRTTTSDVELEVVLLTQDGKDKILNGEPITIADVVDVNTSKYIKVRFRLNKDGLIFTASYIDGVFTHCYLSSIEIDGIQCPSLVVTIPSGTFSDNGYLWVAVTTAEDNEHFEDGKKDTESEFEKTEVQYVNQ